MLWEAPSTGVESNWSPAMLRTSSVLCFNPVMDSIVIICCLVTVLSLISS